MSDLGYSYNVYSLTSISAPVGGLEVVGSEAAVLYIPDCRCVIEVNSH